MLLLRWIRAQEKVKNFLEMLRLDKGMLKYKGPVIAETNLALCFICCVVDIEVD